MTSDHYRSSNPNLSPNPNPNPSLNRSSAVICDVQADRVSPAPKLLMPVSPNMAWRTAYLC